MIQTFDNHSGLYYDFESDPIINPIEFLNIRNVQRLSKGYYRRNIYRNNQVE